MGAPLPDLTTLRDRLRYARQYRGLKASVLSTRAGLSSSHVGIIERGKESTSCSAETARKLADALDISLAWLIAGEGDMLVVRNGTEG